MRATRNRVYGQPYQGFESLRLRHNKKHAQLACFLLCLIMWIRTRGPRVRTAAKRRTGVRRFARTRKFCQVMQRSEIIPSSPPGITKCPTWGILLYPVKRNGANPSQSQIAGSTTSRFDQCNAVKSSRLPRSILLNF